MYVYIYIYMYVCVCVYTYMYIHIHIQDPLSASFIKLLWDFVSNNSLLLPFDRYPSPPSTPFLQ